MLRRGLWVCAAILLSVSPALAASEPGAFSVLFENDLFFNSDEDYTNGIQFSYTTAPEDSPAPIVKFARMLPFFADRGTVRTSYALGQNIYTPKDTTLANPLPTDRPYAGYLYAAVGLLEENPDRLDQLQLEIGVVGPMALAKEAQFFVHSIFDFDKPKGWKTQLRNEPAFVLTYERSLKLIPEQSIFRLVLDIEPHFGGAVGTVYDYANIGAMVRLGFNLPDDFGPLRIEPSLPGSNFFKPTGGFSAYIFAGVDGRAIARNIFLDGNTWQDSRSVVKRNLVGDLSLGAAVTFENVRLAFTHVFRTKEYEGQVSPDEFGAVSLSFRL